METTPSLACANKCVFCWRHHTNPVGKTWKWKMDDPIEIVEAALDKHIKMVKQMKGVPGESRKYSFFYLHMLKDQNRNTFFHLRTVYALQELV
jgi:tRNA wybutosine-synthesizing protein 1